MSSKRKTKITRRNNPADDAADLQKVLVEIVLEKLDWQWRRYGEGFRDDEQKLMLRTLFITMQKDTDPIRQQVAKSIDMSDLEAALETAKRQRATRIPIAHEWVTRSLPLWLNELRQGDIDQFPNKAEFVEHFRDPMYNFDRGIISDNELHEIWRAFFTSHLKEIIDLTRQAQAARERVPVVEGVADFLRDVVAGSSALQATIDLVRDVLGDIVGTAADTGQVRRDVKRAFTSWARRFASKIAADMDPGLHTINTDIPSASNLHRWRNPQDPSYNPVAVEVTDPNAAVAYDQWMWMETVPTRD